MVLAVALLIVDQKLPIFQQVKATAAVAVLPIQYMVDFPIKIVRGLVDSMTTQHSLLSDNARLRAHELLLESRLQRLLVLEQENTQLRELLKSTTHISGRVIVGQLLAVALDPNLQEVVVDRGARQGLYVGQPVLDAYGVMGQLISVGPMTSKVMLISDVKSAIPVQNNRNGIRAIAVGTGSSDKLALINVPETSDIQVGDLLVTSGLGLRYPVGYPVGVVTELRKEAGQRFASISLRPSAHLAQTQQILLAWPDHVALTKAVQQQLQTPVATP